MNAFNAYQVSAFFSIKVIEVGLVLEVVSVYFAFLGNSVRLNVVGEFFNLEGIAFLFKEWLYSIVKNLCMGVGTAATVRFCLL